VRPRPMEPTGGAEPAFGLITQAASEARRPGREHPDRPLAMTSDASATGWRVDLPFVAREGLREGRTGERGTQRYTPSLRTGTSTVAALSAKEVDLYSDLSLHDHKARRGDGNRWRTKIAKQSARSRCRLGYVVEIIGGRTRTRTLDPLIKSQLVLR
jgi:hypothetical protein